MTMQCDTESLLAFNSNNVCVACAALIPNCRECQQSDPQITTCKVCKIPFTGLQCERDCTDGFVQLNEANCQPFSVAFFAPSDQCSGSKHGEVDAPDSNGDIKCTCKTDSKNSNKNFSGPNCERRIQGLNCNGLIPICSTCNNNDCKVCPPGTTSQDPTQGCCMGGCATCEMTRDTDLSLVEPFPPGVCLTCDPDSMRSVLDGTKCIACEDSINNCLKCSQLPNQPPECIICRGKLTGKSCETECKTGQIQYNIAFCQSKTCKIDESNTEQCSGNGACADDAGNLKCVCDEFSTGENCAEMKSECAVENCAQCLTEDVCKICNEQYKLAAGKCEADTCQGVYVNCETCSGVVPELVCTKCAGSYTGEKCDKMCKNEYIQYKVDKCQNPSCASTTPCSGSGECQENDIENKVCLCVDGKSGLNCENSCSSECLTCGAVITECTSCKEEMFLANKTCVDCSGVPNCNECSQESPEMPIICGSCLENFTGASCDKECAEGQIQFNKEFCQAVSCISGATACNGNGYCKIQQFNNFCICNQNITGSNCETLVAGKKCGGGPEIINCITCNGATNQCAKCFNDAKVSDDGLACCAIGCHSCLSSDINECIGCDKTSDKPFYDENICKSCSEVYRNCALCQQIGFFTKINCLACKDDFTGATCKTKCGTGRKKFEIDGCQPVSCDTHVPCSGQGTCERRGDNLFCQCEPGAMGDECQNNPPCGIENCELCDISDSQICKKCLPDHELISKTECKPLTCYDAIYNCMTDCIGQPGGFTCGNCISPYTGNQCDVLCPQGQIQLNQSHCQSQTCQSPTPCNDHGTCELQASGNMECVCDEDFSGHNCQSGCSEPCKTCATDSKTTCLSCYDDDVVQNKTCTNCKKEFPNCQKCGESAPLMCEKCLPQFTLADCSLRCPVATVPYENKGCQPATCITANPCNGHSDCVPQANDLVCQCKNETTGPNCEFYTGEGKMCDGKYVIKNCELCTQDVCGLCQAGSILNTQHTECCVAPCTNCKKGYPEECTKCDSTSKLPYLIDKKCVSCAIIENCSECDQVGNELNCIKCAKAFTGSKCQRDCGSNMTQFNSNACQPSSCTFQPRCGGNGDCELGDNGDKVCRCNPGFGGLNCENHICKVKDCQKCVDGDANKCSKCFNGFDESNDCQECKTGYYKNKTLCEQCDRTCDGCDENGCLGCIEGLVVVDGVCQEPVVVEKSGLPIGAIIGIVVGVIVLLIVIGVIVGIVMKKKRSAPRDPVETIETVEQVEVVEKGAEQIQI